MLSFGIQTLFEVCYQVAGALLGVQEGGGHNRQGNLLDGDKACIGSARDTRPKSGEGYEGTSWV